MIGETCEEFQERLSSCGILLPLDLHLGQQESRIRCFRMLGELLDECGEFGSSIFPALCCEMVRSRLVRIPGLISVNGRTEDQREQDKRDRWI
jgi:hypothetical protein